MNFREIEKQIIDGVPNVEIEEDLFWERYVQREDDCSDELFPRVYKNLEETIKKSWKRVEHFLSLLKTSGNLGNNWMIRVFVCPCIREGTFEEYLFTNLNPNFSPTFEYLISENNLNPRIENLDIEEILEIYMRENRVSRDDLNESTGFEFSLGYEEDG